MQSSVLTMDSVTPSIEVDDVLLAVLIVGLQITDQQLNEKCLAAIVAWGPKIVPKLLEVADKPTTGRLLRRDLLHAKDQIGRRLCTSGVSAAALIVEAILEALRPDFENLNEKALAAAHWLPVSLFDRLINMATKNQNQPKYCARLLRAADQLVSRTNETRHYDLFILASHLDHEVANTAVRLLMKFGMSRLLRMRRYVTVAHDIPDCASPS